FPTTEVTSTTLPTGGLFQTPWGGTLASPLPAFVTAWQASATTPGRVFAGGLYFNPASIQVSVSSGHASFGPVLAAEATGDMHLSEVAVQDVYIHEGAPEQPIMVTQNQVFRITHVSDGGTVATYDRLGVTAPPGGAAPRGVRFARHPIDGGSLGVMDDPNSGFQATQIVGSANESPTFAQLESPTVFPLDFALGSLDGITRPDVAILRADGSGNSSFLSVYPNLTVSPYHVDSIQAVALPAGYTMLAVGDFDGNPSTPDQILVLSKTIAELPERCYELQPTCLAACGVGHC
ncbi:MAG: hypothetical protein NT062_30000, partial [Proteobacteria bacterium]|nr:hypothetical protein [Pseudomonadota bacterium]